MISTGGCKKKAAFGFQYRGLPNGGMVQFCFAGDAKLAVLGDTFSSNPNMPAYGRVSHAKLG
jgi:hypothetical protein